MSFKAVGYVVEWDDKADEGRWRRFRGTGALGDAQRFAEEKGGRLYRSLQEYELRNGGSGEVRSLIQPYEVAK